ncbi:MAG TPA: hypothetical protein DD490_00700 [Acidobacteria bacterium]|nr:hypothetical protein [Acidobacteriota bacterium]
MLSEKRPTSLTWREAPGGEALRSPLRRLARSLFAISARETSFAVRRFRWDTEEIRQRLEGVAATFVDGYHAALETDPPALCERLDAVPPAARGWAYEGAGMALAMLDLFTGWRQGRLRRLLEGKGDPHSYLVNVGAGWTLGRLPISPRRLLSRLDPVDGWLALDGYGFHEGFFQPRRSFTDQKIPRKLSGYARRVFDQGLGRCLWFVEGTHPDRIATAVAAFPAARRDDLWSGVGLACGYAGGVDRPVIESLLRCAGSSTPAFAQGVAFAAEARERAGCTPEQTELACRTVWGAGAAAVAAGVRQAGIDLPADGEVPAFEAWRRRIQSHFSQGGAR